MIAVTEPPYPISGRVGFRPIGVPQDAALVLLAAVYGLADEAQEEALYDSQALPDFVDIDLSRE